MARPAGSMRAALRAWLFATLLATLALACLPAWAAPNAMRSYRALALSGDGQRIAAIEMGEGDAQERIVVRRSRDGDVVPEWVQPDCRACRLDGPAWSPDGQALAVVASDPKAGAATVWVLRVDDATAVATIRGVAGTVRWSPDGRRLAVLAVAGARKLAGAVEAGARQVGEIGAPAQEDEQRIAVVPANGGRLRFVSPADTWVYEYDWTPDGRGFVVTSARGNGDNNWWLATLGHVDADSGLLRVLAAPKIQMSMPRVSSDGATVAFIGGLMSDFGSVGGDVYTVPLAPPDAGQGMAAPVDVTPDYRGSFTGIAWRGGALLASVLAGADTGVAAIDMQARSVRLLWRAPVSAATANDGGFAFSTDGAVAASVLEDFEHAPRIVAGRLPALAPITHENDGLPALVAARSVGWTNDGFDMQGWLLGPKDAASDGRHPMVVQLHGGPASASTPHYVAPGDGGNALLGDLVRAGYFVFLPNPRGSFGQSAAFTAANRRDFGGGDWRDILAGVDAVLAQAPVDGGRLGLMGHSYGGFLAMWGVTQGARFKAAVAGAGIANWISYYGQNGIDQWMVPYFGAPMYEEPAAYRAASPIEFVRGAKTPTLLYVGERDVECPPAQSLEFWHGLRALGVPATLVIYEGEGHALRQPRNQRDLRVRALAWFERYLRR
jgi:dipeptidyl aminopeptidase/acylaminoacyl peptidase